MSLVATLESPLPASLPADTRTAVFVYGTCAAPVEVSVAGVRRRTEQVGDRFWATVPVRARGSDVEIAVAGNGAIAPLARIEVGAPRRPPSLGRPAPEGLIAICMATFEPDMALFRTQIESLRAQTDERWICVVSDDASAPEHFAQIRELLADDPRFLLSRSQERLGFYRNFERALRLAPAEARLLALCDQDDRWWPEKLEVLREAIGGAGLVYSDQRLVDADGRVLRDTLWRGRRNNHTDLVSMLVANTITGAAMMMRREVAELALPFPDTPGHAFHDAWLAAVALAAGEVAYVDRPLYDYVQHRAAFFGSVTHGPRPRRRRSQARGSYFLRLPASRRHGGGAARPLRRAAHARQARRAAPLRPRGAFATGVPLAGGAPAARPRGPHRDARERERAAPGNRVAPAGQDPPPRREPARPAELRAAAPAALAGPRLG